MHVSVSEIFLSLHLLVKVKGCMLLLFKKISSEIRTENGTCGHVVDMNMLCKTHFIEANQAISARKRHNAAWSPSFHPLHFPLHAGDHHGFLH